MHRFFLITHKEKEGGGLLTSSALEEACKREGVEYIALYEEDTHMTDLPKLDYGDLLYRDSTKSTSRDIEKAMLNQKCSHFYADVRTGIGSRSASYVYHQKIGLPIIPTFRIIRKDREELAAMVEAFGGYPVVLKVLGGSHGVGVIRIDSSDSLFSILDYVHGGGGKILLRKYIDHEYSLRVVVIGSEVIEAHKNFVDKGDFRSNVVREDRKREVVDLPKDIQKLAVDAVRACGLEMGGVDILFDTANTLYIAEVNFPCDFFPSQEVSGIDIAGSIVRYLKNKSVQNHGAF